MRKIKVYVAGPITKPEPTINTRNACLMGDRLLSGGFLPFVPHTCHLWQLISPKDYETWMEYDLCWVTQCDALIRLPGESPGADREVEHAQFHNIPVFHDYFELVAHFSIC